MLSIVIWLLAAVPASVTSLQLPINSTEFSYNGESVQCGAAGSWRAFSMHVTTAIHAMTTHATAMLLLIYCCSHPDAHTVDHQFPPL